MIKILIIDDEVDLSRLTAKFLHKSGYEIYQHHHDTKVIETIRRVEPHLILLDIQMPQVSGLDIFKDIYNQEDLCHIPVIFFSAIARSDPMNLESFKAAGSISKPYELDALLKTIKRALVEKRETSQ